MWKQSVWTSTISSHLATKHLKEGGLLTLAGAQAALSGTPGKRLCMTAAGTPAVRDSYLSEHILVCEAITLHPGFLTPSTNGTLLLKGVRKVWFYR